MACLRTLRAFPAALIALTLASAVRAQADGVVDFGFYPEGAQDCLYSAADSSRCESKTVEATNACFCRNGGDFITTAAACIGRSSRDDLRTTYRTMREACGNSETPITITEDEFMEAADDSGPTTTQSSSTATSSTTSTATTTSTSTPPPDDKEDEGSSGLSTAALAGIIVGAIPALGLLGALAFIVLRRRKKMGEELHPMLPQQAHHSMAFSASDATTAYYSSPPPDSEAWPKKDWGASPDPRSSVRASGFNWESPSHLAYPAAALAPSPPLQIQELDGRQHFPPGSTEAPVEMGGSPVTTSPPPSRAGQYQPYNPGHQ
ncbi:hypothetical protein MYCTH_2298376 [Thermothelomyces thermophilus ATCC 42464]|uniref:Extracellular membrane protein CFEM domain-containing protein n=1 Tax=Thermothelomyces thermophilus (strain ATCC 42464 / BCRC 31852 / DSM 1799) TaxID=573729 RepID=G2Q1N7_THET4|nr:uncharacterized protein MYCTH_2298376 [Thermothelomyces thermophilus ATCC 42464]AEO55028.1 hypothetical protein MYCTH_2298376 [Thermothelomyces thermophilus ATCC 42464]